LNHPDFKGSSKNCDLHSCRAVRGTVTDNVCTVTMDGKKAVTPTLTKPKGIVADTTFGF
jgi:hypothetical protein